MKTLEIQLITSGLSILLLAAHWSEITAVDEQDPEANDSRVVLPPELESFANEARAHIAKVIQENLIRLFATISAQTEGSDDVKINPAVLPQMAEIIGAIHSGRMNVTKIVDETSPLVSVDLRDQLNGLVELLTGSDMDISPDNSTTTEPEAEFTKEEVKFESGVTSTKGKKKTASKLRQSAPSTPMKLNKKQIKKLMVDIKKAAKKTETETKVKNDSEPKGFLENFRRALAKADLNSTEVSKNVPSIFMGAYKAIQALSYLGIMKPVSNFIEYELDYLGFIDSDVSSEIASGLSGLI